MRPVVVALLAAVFSCSLITVALADFQSIGPGHGILIDNGTRDLPCAYGNLLMNADQQYENGYSVWGPCLQPPYYGAWAECFQAPFENWEVCGVVIDLTRVYDCDHYLLDAYVWEDDNGNPGTVLAVTTGFDPYPIAFWPYFSRHVVTLGATVSGTFWVGEWGNWPAQHGTCTYFIAVDENVGRGEVGCPRINISPDCAWPVGWQHTDVIFGEGSAKALGIGCYGHRASPTSSAPEPAIHGTAASWGKLKALYR